MDNNHKEFFSRKFYSLKNFLNKLIYLEIILLILIPIFFVGFIYFDFNVDKFLTNFALGYFILNIFKIVFIHHYTTFCGFYGYLLKHDKTIYED